MSSPYHWRGATFEAPPLEDESVLSFVEYDNDRAVASMTVTEDHHDGPLQEFVDATAIDIEQTFVGWRQSVLASTDTLIVTTHSGRSPNGAQSLARAFRQVGTAVFCFTAMGPQNREDKLVHWVRSAATSLTTSA